MTARTAKEWVALEAATAADLNKSAGGYVGDKESSSDSTGITTTATTVLSEDVTFGTARRALAVVTIEAATTVADDLVSVTFYEGATLLRRWRGNLTTTGGPGHSSFTFHYSWAATAGAATYAVKVERESGSGSLTVYSSSQMTILDVGSTT